MPVFLTRGAPRFARKQQIADESLVEAIERAERGIIDVDLGGGLIKQRVARLGRGRSGGFRTRAARRTVVLHGFAKKDRENIDDDELEALRTIGPNWLAASAEPSGQAVTDVDVREIDHDDEA